MKIFICLLASLCVCNATFFSLLGAKGGSSGGGGGGISSLLGGLGGGQRTVTYDVVAHPHKSASSSGGYAHGHSSGSAGGSYAHGHGHAAGGAVAAPQVIKVILEESQGYSNGGAGGYAAGHGASYGASHGASYGASHGASYGASHGASYGGAHGASHGASHGGYASGHSYSAGGDAGHSQIYKVIQQSGPAPVATGYSAGGYASGHSYGQQSYASGHSYSSGGGYSSDANAQFNAILPQILQLILQDESSGSANDGAYNAQLIDTFGRKGKVIIMRNSGTTAQQAYFKGGHVVQKGHLEVKRLESNQQQQQQASSGWSSSNPHQQQQQPLQHPFKSGGGGSGW